jgi:type II secretory pathway component PulF
MPTFVFRAKAADGRVIRGTRASASEAALAMELAQDSMFLVHAESGQVIKSKKLRGPRLKRKELIAFLIHLGSYVEAGVPLLAALEDYRLPERPAVDEALQDIRRRIEGGSSFSEAMEVYPTLFNRLHLNMIRAGETTGRLDESLREVVKLIEWEEDFAGQVKQASTYPIIVLSIVGLVVLVVSTFALPVIIKMLKELNVPLPLVTRIFMGIGEVAASWGWMVAIVLVIGIVSFRIALRQPEVRLWWDTRILHMPLLGALTTKLGLSRFATFFAAQYRAGIPIVQVLKECQDVTGNARLALCVRRIAEGVESGSRLAIMAASVGYFPALVVRMLAIGEEAGNLEVTLGKVSTYFDAEVKAGIKRFFQLLEPVLVVTLAGVLLFVAASILLPIYTLIGNINASAH